MNRVAMITGSSRGMGKAEAYEFASRGYDVIVHYVNSKEAAENISEDIKKKYGVKTAVIKADLAKESEVRELASKALEVFGRVDVLVNNAGIALYDEFQKKTVQGFEQSMQVNLYAPFLLTQILGAEMVKNKYGKIVNIATIDVMTTYNAESAEYDASKAALISLTKTSSLQFAPYVNVNCVCPGWVATDMNKDLPQELLDYQASKTCKGRMAKPEEVAKLVAFLASDDAEFIDGEVIKIDGGYKLM
ncbi:MAG: SDR family oxidoreductase [Roseburia sp.]|uniref:SDR family NAD(P)-dependent oxidoreductase n=1 Tax=Roseburia sp. 831b TaxID=1261635 RepID=UPI000950DCF1|nr:SDR family oxidoreductase [Roseburia sp. 831b]MCI5919202.1 SDR family oxidoreductase [Roseburia sp.]MDD6215745.1 SDR family oxidoreductase [Roseburia sp.]MDY5884193.1 SDR family oxidoreductase [Roseburia sp.]WVK74524.1 SDR family oxidoreductase [Roseburia sp. 831b]